MTYYVYELVDPRTHRVFYVGKGKGRRIDNHELEARKGRQSRKCDVIRSIEAEGLSVLKRKVAHFKDEQEAYDKEAEIITDYGLENLTNVIPGGGGAVCVSGHTVYRDRMIAKVVSRFIWHSRGGKITTIYIYGHKMDLSDIYQTYMGWLREIIARRGLEWVNQIARRQNVILS